jgi:hypothetical protein
MVFTGKDRQAQEQKMNSWQQKVLSYVTVEKGLSNEELVKKGAATVVLVPSLRFLDWLLVGASMTLFSALKYKGLNDRLIWLILWMLNMFLSGAVVLFNDMIKVDITLMQTLRKAVNVIISRSRTIGYVTEAIIVGRLLVWDGPDQLIIFFRDRLRSKLVILLFFVISSGIQMFIWTKIYNYGYDGISDLIKTKVFIKT